MKNIVSAESPFHDATQEFREDFEMANMMLNYAVRKNVGAFSLSGLKVPPILHDRQIGSVTADITEFAIELCVFQDHLYDRIVSLMDNMRLQREIWRINERTREFRECELRMSRAANDIADSTVSLMNALFDQDVEAATKIIDECYERRLSLVDDIVGRMTLTDERIS